MPPPYPYGTRSSAGAFGLTAPLAGLFLLLLGGGVLAYGIADLKTLIRGFGDDKAVVVAQP
jgi:hypothetical protein